MYSTLSTLVELFIPYMDKAERVASLSLKICGKPLGGFRQICRLNLARNQTEIKISVTGFIESFNLEV